MIFGLLLSGALYDALARNVNRSAEGKAYLKSLASLEPSATTPADVGGGGTSRDSTAARSHA
jgi:hypothetical protein